VTGEKQRTTSYTNTLHEALLAKDGPTFWKCWQSKFEGRPNCTQVDGCTKPEAIAENFMHYFSKIYIPNSDSRAMSLYKEYMLQRQNYF